MIDIHSRIESINNRISSASEKSGRKPQSVNLTVISKRVSVENISAAIKAGVTLFGENFVQEAKTKINTISNKNISWHMTGHLQKNKASTAVRLFDLIHTLDTETLAEKLNGEAKKIKKIQQVLIQVNLSQEETKSGIREDDLLPFLNSLSTFKNIKVNGLMTMPPFFSNPEEGRTYFKALRLLRDKAESFGYSLPELSMGMSNDFEVAIQEGATYVRIGTAIFGERTGK